MIIFHSTDLDKATGTLQGDEYRHCIKVLRHKVGDSIFLTDGKGTLASGVIEQINKRSVQVEIGSLELKDVIVPSIELAVCLPKSSARVEFMLEKLVELGVSIITPLVSQRSERRKINLDRLSKKIVSASTQSGHVHFPIMNELISFEEFIESLDYTKGLYCHYKKDNPQLKDIDIKNKDITIIVGPEGDFSEEELALMDNKSIKSVNLGNHRLRTETAAIAACTIWRIMNR